MEGWVSVWMRRRGERVGVVGDMGVVQAYVAVRGAGLAGGHGGGGRRARREGRAGTKRTGGRAGCGKKRDVGVGGCGIYGVADDGAGCGVRSGPASEDDHRSKRRALLWGASRGDA